MGFNCLRCGKREIWAQESNVRPRVCKRCAGEPTIVTQEEVERMVRAGALIDRHHYVITDHSADTCNQMN